MNDRSWMYNKNLPGRSGTNKEFLDGVQKFLEFAVAQSTESHIRCPCYDCGNKEYYLPSVVKDHLFRRGFIANYHRWICHGESRITSTPPVLTSAIGQTFPRRNDYDALNPQQRMVFDAAGPNFVPPWAADMNPNSEQCHGNDYSSSSHGNPTSPDHQPEINTNVDDDIGSSKKFWATFEAANEPLWSGCETETQLSAITELLRIKSTFNLSENCYNRICEWAGRCMPEDHIFPTNYYQTKKIVKSLGLPMEKIDICPGGCMLYWKVDAELHHCRFCKQDRYQTISGKTRVARAQLRYLPLIPRLQRLFASSTTAAHMRWHKEHETQDGMMCHPSDSESWKHFDRTYPEFANEPRNVRLALCSDGFAPFGQSGKVYSCWPIIVTPYNLPPSMCLKTPYMFLTMVVPGPHNPKKLLDICMQPLVEELNLLRREGVPTFDISRGDTFRMRAALLWTINDFPAYGMMSGWSTAGKMACPVCMDATKAFWLVHGKKCSWFDCHRKFLPKDHPYRRNKRAFYKNREVKDSAPPRLTGDQMWNEVKDLPTVMVDPLGKIPGYGKLHKWMKQSIFWQLPYWKTHFIRHNLDVMHIEKNVFDNVFNTVMDVKGKSKDTLQSRRDLKLYCSRPELQVDADHCGSIPKAVYTLTKTQKVEVCNWIKSVKFPDGYAANIGRCVQIADCRLIGMKSHDCHIFMQRLLPIAFKELLPESVWGPLTELSQFFQSLCSPTITIAQMEELDKVIRVLVCKLESIFPPSFVDSMEHLLIHLPYEALVGGPVQYRWMYPFERFLHHLKKKVSNKARVEASICSSYIIEEISTFTSHYFEPRISSNRKRPRSTTEAPSRSTTPHFSIFNYPGHGFGKSKSRWLSDNPKEMHAIETYVLLNCPEVDAYAKIFCDQSSGDVDKDLDANFMPWFKDYVNHNDIQDEFIKRLAWGPNAEIRTCSGYEINGYTFHTLEREQGKVAMNSGIWVKGSSYNEEELDYYGQLEEIITLQYTGLPLKEVVLFKCRWFNPTTGIRRVNPKYDMVEVNHKRRYKTNDCFILAQQAIQVYYTKYPAAKRDRVDWWAACKTKPRSMIEQKWTEPEAAYQTEELPTMVTIDEPTTENFRDPSGAFIEIDDEQMGDEVPNDERGDTELSDPDAEDDGLGFETNSENEPMSDNESHIQNDEEYDDW